MFGERSILSIVRSSNYESFFLIQQTGGSRHCGVCTQIKSRIATVSSELP
ncbi:hypothetical protein AAG906_040969 [Vitis piasezkii]